MSELATLAWRRPPAELPDAEINVLLAHGERETCEGFLDGLDAAGTPIWRDTTAWPVAGVYAWAELPEGPAP